jgi:predicted PolB exonuclease-like 3'-5' exonuclease
MHDRLLCLDIETVPDRDLVPADWGHKFPKPMWHRVVAISVVEAVIERDDAGRERYRVECCRSGGEADWDERRLLQAWWRHFSDCSARVVTWNGKGFDLPVLRLRAMIYGIPAEPWFTRGDKWNGYTQRYAPDWHCDLMDQLADYGAHARMSLQEAAVALGLPGKIGGNGAEVADMVERGEVDKVRAYCEADCLNLFVLYVRWAFLTGRLDAAGHDARCRASWSACRGSARSGRILGRFSMRGAARRGRRRCSWARLRRVGLVLAPNPVSLGRSYRRCTSARAWRSASLRVGCCLASSRAAGLRLTGSCWSELTALVILLRVPPRNKESRTRPHAFGKMINYAKDEVMKVIRRA